MNSYQFFLKHAGYSYDPATQSPMQGRIQCARKLAAAERKARDAGISYQWEYDGADSSEWIADNEDGGRNCNPWQTWACCAIPSGEDADQYGTAALASLGGIDFGRDGEPWGNPYRRVVEAELALEALDNLKGGKS
jgi:hypothetical protein